MIANNVLLNILKYLKERVLNQHKVNEVMLSIYNVCIVNYQTHRNVNSFQVKNK